MDYMATRNLLSELTELNKQLSPDPLSLITTNRDHNAEPTPL